MQTKVNSLHENLSIMNEKEYIEKFLIYNLSTVIADAKPAATISFKKNDENYKKWLMYGTNFIRDIALEYVDLREDEKSIIILVYSKDTLLNYIGNEENYKFLIKLGYSKTISIEAYLQKLKERYCKFKCPHELGIFLGFPINDVKDFMECTQKKCLLCGYWKVYNNYTEALKTFCNYDEIKKQTVQSILNGTSSCNLINFLRNNKNSLYKVHS